MTVSPFGINGRISLTAYNDGSTSTIGAAYELSQKHRILILDGGFSFSICPNITVRHIYRRRNKIERLFFKLSEHISAIDENIWYGDWRDRIGEYDTVIIYDGIRSPSLIKYIRRRNQRARIIIYYYNTFTDKDRNAPHRYRDLGVELYTFDSVAAQKYNMNFKPYFYEHEQEATIALNKHLPIEYDALFFGSDKGRLGKVLELKKMLNTVGLTTKISVYANKRKHYSDQEKQFLVKGWADYSAIAEATSRSRAIIDIVAKGQAGLTLRPMEALFMRKKLITDNTAIVNYDLYAKDNVFILGQDDPGRLKSFVTSPYIPVREAILNNYRQETWLEGFFR